MIASDRGPQYTSDLWAELCDMLNISHRQTTAYHLEKDCIAASRMHFMPVLLQLTWAEETPWVLLRLCSQPREDTGVSLAEAVFGAPCLTQ
jgi:hypothetical protein